MASCHLQYSGFPLHHSTASEQRETKRNYTGTTLELTVVGAMGASAQDGTR